jgi:hypothetical protein
MTSEESGARTAMEKYSRTEGGWIYHGGSNAVELPPGSIVEPGKNYKITYTVSVPGQEPIVNTCEAYLESVVKMKKTLNGDIAPERFSYNLRRTDRDTDTALTYLTTDGKTFRVQGPGIANKFTHLEFEAINEAEKAGLKGTALSEPRS